MTIARSKFSAFLGSLAIATTLLAAGGTASALGAPVLDVAVTHAPASGVAKGGKIQYAISVSNAGDAETGAPVSVEFAIPVGLEITEVSDEVNDSFKIPTWDCTTAVDAQSVSCTGPEFFGSSLPIYAGEEACVGELGASCKILITAAATPDMIPHTVLDASAVASGGGAASSASSTDPTLTWESFDVIGFEAANRDEAIQSFTQAGGHPFENFTSFEFPATFTRDFEGNGLPTASEQVKNVAVDVPPGLIGNPSIAARCTEAQLANKACPSDSQVGTVKVIATDGSFQKVPLSNMFPPVGKPAAFGFNIIGVTWAHIFPTVRSNGDYGLTVTATEISQLAPLLGVPVTFWGVPADHSHDAERRGPGCEGGCASNLQPKAFLSLPTSCEASQEMRIRADSWTHPGDFATSTSQLPANTGCNGLDFSPTLKARPTTNVADSPSGLEVDLKIPQNDDPLGTAEAHLRKATVTLPPGLVINPSGANGLKGCTLAQVDLQGEGGVSCPDASKVGTVEVETPLLDHPMGGYAYVAQPHDNPFNSLIALYLVVDDPQSGIVIKLPGKVSLDSATGRITSTFTENPQLPFEHLKVDFFGGATAPLRTPATCGSYSTTSSLTPWSAPDSGPPVTPSDTYAINAAPSGAACPGSPAELPNAPAFDAGTISPIAGIESPIVVSLRRADGSQEFGSLTLTPPQGLLARLAGIPYCSEQALSEAAAKGGHDEEAAPSCPQASRVGSVSVGAGAGPAPYYATGSAYLAGPYKGAPLSLAAVTPATAGPFDLGTVVVRTALHIDRRTAQIRAVTDPIPSILQGIPLDVRSIQVKLDRSGWGINPTSCDASSFGGEMQSLAGLSVALVSRFQVAECGRLGFKPKLSLSLKGSGKRGKYPALTAVLTPRADDANIASISVALPHSEFLAQEHIRTVCTRVQFAADQCPANSVYGTATVTTPLLDYPLTGNVYLRSSSNKLPDLVPDLRGPSNQPIKLEADGRTDSVNGGIRNTFDFVPDAPFTKFVLQLKGGKKGLLLNSVDLCSQMGRATVKFGAHNGATLVSRPVLKAPCGKASGKKRGSARRGSRRGAR
jgi:hypothetical protein